MKKLATSLILTLTLVACCPDTADRQWTAEYAHEWYSRQEWPVGCNYVPSYAINQYEFWQEETFDPQTIDKELGLVNVGVVTVKNTCYPSNKQQRIAFWRRQVLLHLRNYFLDEALSEFHKLARFGNHHSIVVQIHHNHAVQIVLAIFRLELIGRNAENVRERRLQEQ